MSALLGSLKTMLRGRSISPLQRRAGVRVQDDLFVGDTLFGLGLGAVLAEANTVAEAVTVDEADGFRLVEGSEKAAFDFGLGWG